MIDGFIPYSRGTLMLDVVATAMLAIIPLLAWSIYLVRFRRNYRTHQRVNMAIALVLLGAVVLFEVDMRLYGWRHLAEPSSLYDSWVYPILYIHLAFAIATTGLWVTTVVPAMRRFSHPPRPNGHSRFHRGIARFAAVGMLGTATTGWAFYIIAFMM